MRRKAGEWSSTREAEFQAVAAVGNRFRSGNSSNGLVDGWRTRLGRCWWEESTNGGRRWLERRRGGSARLELEEEENEKKNTAAPQGDKGVHGMRMAGAWYENGRRRWRCAARRDSCSAHWSRVKPEVPVFEPRASGILIFPKHGMLHVGPANGQLIASPYGRHKSSYVAART